MPKYAISDIHGCLQTFEVLLEDIGFSQSDELYLLGDYIDRGPDSKGVIDHIWQLQEEGYQLHCLRGNHEQMLLEDFVNEGTAYPGDIANLMSFGVSSNLAIPRRYIDWMDGLDYYFEVDNYILVHAGLNFDAPDPLKEYEDMLWIRNWHHQINHKWLDGRIIVHGHTPQRDHFLLKGVKNIEATGAINIDGGCVFDIRGMGQLCALDLTNRRMHIAKKVEP